MIVKRVNLCALDTGSLTLGYVGENDHTQIRINCASVFADYPSAVVSMTVKAPSGVVYPREVETDGQVVIWTITDSDTASAGNGQIQLTFTEDGTIVKTVIAVTTVRASLVGDNPPPDPITDWIDEAGEALAKLEGMTASATQLPAGEDPTAEVEVVDGHYNIALGIPGGDAESIIDDTAGVGDTTKVWSANKSATELSELKRDIDRKAPAIYQDASGDIVSFADGADGMPLSSCVVQINPVQDTSGGDPSPSHICPITGANGCNIFRTGFNRAGGFESGSFSESKAAGSAYDAMKTSSTTRFRTKNLIKTAGEPFAVSADFTAYRVCMVMFDENRQYIGRDDGFRGWSSANYNNSGTGIYYVALAVKRSDEGTISETDIANCHVQLESGSGYSIYVPYVGQTYPISWQTAAGTVYGGTVDTVTGVLTVDRVFVEIDGTNKAVVFHKTGSAATAFRYGIVESADYADGTKNQISNYLHKASQDQTANGKQEYAVYANNGTLYLTLPLEIEDADDANAYLAQHNLQVVYYLVTPRTIQLDPVQIKTLMGYNALWADTGAVAVTYPADTKSYVDDHTPVQDVQINGVSVLSNGVANVPIASISTLGVIQIQTNRGLTILDGGIIAINSANESTIKSGVSGYLPITPGSQHQSVFYGLAKLAGENMASSSNPVGQYTDAAKDKIMKMIGILDMIAPYESTGVATRAYSVGDCFIQGGHLYRATASISIGVSFSASNCEQTTLMAEINR